MHDLAWDAPGGHTTATIEPLCVCAANPLLNLHPATRQIRFNVVQRADPLFLSVEFNQSNWPREACAVCSLDISADVTRWRDAVGTAVREIKRLGVHGISESELARYRTAILAPPPPACAGHCSRMFLAEAFGAAPKSLAVQVGSVCLPWRWGTRLLCCEGWRLRSLVGGIVYWIWVWGKGSEGAAG